MISAMANPLSTPPARPINAAVKKKTSPVKGGSVVPASRTTTPIEVSPLMIVAIATIAR
jgi:hypothetical protein